MIVTDRYDLRDGEYHFVAPTNGVLYIRDHKLDQGEGWGGGGYYISTSSDGNESNTFEYFYNTSTGEIDLRLAEGDQIYLFGRYALGTVFFHPSAREHLSFQIIKVEEGGNYTALENQEVLALTSIAGEKGSPYVNTRNRIYMRAGDFLHVPFGGYIVRG